MLFLETTGGVIWLGNYSC